MKREKEIKKNEYDIWAIVSLDGSFVGTRVVACYHNWGRASGDLSFYQIQNMAWRYCWRQQKETKMCRIYLIVGLCILCESLLHVGLTTHGQIFLSFGNPRRLLFSDPPHNEFSKWWKWKKKQKSDSGAISIWLVNFIGSRAMAW